ncbi:hypothetical protein FQA39_LY09117 [Lamprigera yunnana]|nr:hypothetical protein FQA39_LY09117 [Lamprigera yunnana]
MVVNFSKMIFYLCFVSCFALSTQIKNNFCDDTLQLVHLVFRHGDRTPVYNVTYPTDPNANETYFPYEIGGLTNKGKYSAYNLGVFLRNRYNRFLGELYTTDLIDAVSSGITRTTMSLELVLAGLFPPKGTPLEWNAHLNWQPTIYKQLSLDNKLLMSPFNSDCDTFHELYKMYLKSEEGTAMLKSYINLYRYIQENTKWDAHPVVVLLTTFDTLLVQKQFGLELPEWTKAIFPEIHSKPMIDFFRSTSATSKLKQLTGGYLLKKIIKDTKLKLENKIRAKMMLYSAHDSTVFYILNAMEVLKPHLPPYSACVMVELHTIKSINSIRILYHDYSNTDPKVLVIPGCAEYCPFASFIKLLEKNIPPDSLCKYEPACC